jgi:hypothetical protein
MDELSRGARGKGKKEGRGSRDLFIATKAEAPLVVVAVAVASGNVGTGQSSPVDPRSNTQRGAKETAGRCNQDNDRR